MKPLLLRFENFSQSFIDVVSAYVKHHVDVDYIEKRLDVSLNLVELCFFSNNNIIMVQNSVYDVLLKTILARFTVKTILLDNDDFIIEQLRLLSVEVKHIGTFYYAEIKDSHTKLVSMLVRFYRGYRFFKKDNNFIDTVSPEPHAFDHQVDYDHQIAELFKKNKKGNLYTILPNYLSYKDNYIYVYDIEHKINILNNALCIKDFYYDFENELLVNNRVLVTEPINDLIKEKTTFKCKPFIDIDTALNFCFFLDIKNIKCIQHERKVYYVSPVQIDFTRSVFHKGKYCNKHKLDPTLTSLEILNVQSMRTFSNFNIETTCLDYALCSKKIKLNKLHRGCFQVVNCDISIGTIYIDSTLKAKITDIIKRRFYEGYFLTPFERYLYYQNKQYTDRNIDTELKQLLQEVNPEVKSEVKPEVKSEVKSEQDIEVKGGTLKCDMCGLLFDEKNIIRQKVKSGILNLCKECYTKTNP